MVLTRHFFREVSGPAAKAGPDPEKKVCDPNETRVAVTRTDAARENLFDR